MKIKFSKGNYICGLDIGTSKLAASVAKLGKSGVKDFYIEEAPSAGIKDGLITDLSIFSNCIKSLMEKLENKSGIKIKNIFIGFFGPYIQSQTTKTIIPLAERGNKVITSSDIRKVREQARNLGSSWEKEIIHEVPQGYSVDSNEPIMNPLGLYGHSLAVELYLLTSPISSVENFIRAVSQAGYNVEDVVISSLAIDFATKKDNKDYVIIDFGENFTRVLFFKKGILNSLQAYNFGANTLTQGISSSLDVQSDLAKEIKEKYAVAVSGSVLDNQEVMIKTASGYSAVKRKRVCQAVEAALEPLFSALKYQIEQNTSDKYNPPEILACGGTVLLEGFVEAAESVTGRPFKVINVKDVNFNPSSKDVRFASAIGLIFYGVESLKVKKLKSMVPLSLAQRVYFKIKEIYLDYF